MHEEFFSDGLVKYFIKTADGPDQYVLVQIIHMNKSCQRKGGNYEDFEMAKRIA